VKFNPLPTPIALELRRDADMREVERATETTATTYSVGRATL
jgi:hypothetical protein